MRLGFFTEIVTQEVFTDSFIILNRRQPGFAQTLQRESNQVPRLIERAVFAVGRQVLRVVQMP